MVFVSVSVVLYVDVGNYVYSLLLENMSGEAGNVYVWLLGRLWWRREGVLMVREFLWSRRRLLGAVVVCVVLVADLAMLWQIDPVTESGVLDPMVQLNSSASSYKRLPF